MPESGKAYHLLDAHVILLFDCYRYPVHISEEFRSIIPPHIHLIYVLRKQVEAI